MENPPALTRQPNTSLKLPQRPDTSDYHGDLLFQNISFSAPVALATPSGETNRLFIVERPGRIVVVTNLAQPTRTVFLDIKPRVYSYAEAGLLGLAFHPDYQHNGFFYVFYVSKGQGILFDTLSRFQVSPDNPSQADPDSESILIRQPDRSQDHNAGDLQFGPDGYLYVSLGDEGIAAGSYRENTQRIDHNFFSGILRLDVDKRPGNLPPNPHPASSSNYSVPADNPFVGAIQFNLSSVDPNQVRTEFFAVGLRNPWRIAFDPLDGTLYCADVGSEKRDEVNIIVKGGNYGWDTAEGPSPFPDLHFVDPIFSYGRDVGKCIIGGVVYRGQTLPELHGAYVFADYVSGRISALWSAQNKLVKTKVIGQMTGISSFGIDPRDGGILFCNVDENSVRKLIKVSTPTQPIPLTLSATGLFKDVATLTPADGVVPYQVNVPQWSSNAVAKRWFCIPDLNDTIGFARTGNWTFPASTVWVQHFDIEVTNGVLPSKMPIETRLLVRNFEGAYGLSYRWGDSRTDATLVSDQGTNETVKVPTGTGFRNQNWHFPSRNECVQCHTREAGWALGFNTTQLNRPMNPNESTRSQIEDFSAAGYFAKPVSNARTLPALAALQDESISREFRVRSYLAANCAHCHRPDALDTGFFDARVETPTALAGLINGPVADTKGNELYRILTPGTTATSMLLSRMTPVLGRFYPMPPLGWWGDTNAATVINSWVTQDLPAQTDFPAWQTNHFSSSADPDAQPSADPDGDGASNYLEFLTLTSPRDASKIWKPSITLKPQGPAIQFHREPNRSYEVQWRTALDGSTSWQPLDAPENRPLFLSQPAESEIVDSGLDDREKYYRVRISEP